MSAVRIIKKYPNRRLYDTAESRYITLSDVRELVLKGVPFEVIDKKSSATITRAILLQVISEQEHQGHSVLSEDFLARIIRAYEEPAPQTISAYLDESLAKFLEQRKDGEPVSDGVDKPVGVPAELARENMDRWADRQKQALASLQGGALHTNPKQD